MEDLMIVKLLFERDEQGIAEAEKKYRALCLSIARNILGSDEDARECVNDAYLVLWENAAEIHSESLMAYLCGIVRNLALKRLEYETAQKRDRSMTVCLSELEGLLPDVKVQDLLESKELGAEISRFLRSEAELERYVFIRRYWFFDPIETISSRLSCSPGRVKGILFRMRKRLRKHLLKEGYEI